MTETEKYDIAASKFVGDNVTAKEIKAGKPLSIFNEHRANEGMWIAFQTRVPEVTEGVYTCKCGCKKIYVVKEQRRGGDEAMTFFAYCTKPSCKKVWVI